MIYTLKNILAVSAVTFLVWGNVSCAESEQSLGAVAPPKNMVNTKPTTENTQNDAQSFNVFYARYRELVKTDNFAAIAMLTEFPFTFKGQLDVDGVLEVEKDEFLTLFPKFVQLETDVEIGGESYEMLTKMSIVTTAEKPIFTAAGTARLHDLVFSRVNNTWMFSMAYTRLDDLIETK